MARKMQVDPRATVVTLISSEDMSSAAGLAVKQDAGGTVSISDAATDTIVGVCVDGGNASGDAVAICKLGRCKIRAGAAINEGARLTSESGGRLIATTTLGNYTIGMAENDAADGDYFWAIITPGRVGTYA
tara:strand:- start:527 stop:919 length:393 start_codon:yes stop_codon:yes gene_type:complete